jgi:hypothetical protein
MVHSSEPFGFNIFITEYFHSSEIEDKSEIADEVDFGVDLRHVEVEEEIIAPQKEAPVLSSFDVSDTKKPEFERHEIEDVSIFAFFNYF